eukprot:m.45183 g.45183  ORF g.45183 m.45183 type:complete len:515 (+) comp6619_c0_seq2:54-1598(+)
MAPTTVLVCLDTLGLTVDSLKDCEDLTAELRAVRRAYLQKVLKAHPDKGGTIEEFEPIQFAFNEIRRLHKSRPEQSLTTLVHEHVDFLVYDLLDERDIPSWEFYAEVAQDEVAPYRIEEAPSSRSHCSMHGKKNERCPAKCGLIPQGSIRAGMLEEVAGTYTRWVHIDCWRVPARIWQALPDPITTPDPEAFETALMAMDELVISGLSELSHDHLMEVVYHTMDTTAWAALRKTPAPTTSTDANAASSGASRQHHAGHDDDSDHHAVPCHKCGTLATDLPGRSADGAALCAACTALAPETDIKSSVEVIDPEGYKGRDRQDNQHLAVPKPKSYLTHARQPFVAPAPGKHGAKPQLLAGKRVALTGIFPEVGGGSGLSFGKDRVKAIVAAFGGRVTSCVSGKTDFLIVGKNPGLRKVMQARESDHCVMMSLHDFKIALESGNLTPQRPMIIDNFSSGYRGRGLALSAPPSVLAIASGKASAKALEDRKRLASSPEQHGRSGAESADKKPRTDVTA